MLSRPETGHPKRAKRWLRFSVRGLLVVTLVVAAYFGGRTSRNAFSGPDLAGSWSANLPGGAKQPTTLRALGQDQWLIQSRASVFSGVYQFVDGQLTVIQPDDKRMTGLIWRWDDRQLVLIAEPPAKPTGASYLGTVLAPVKDSVDDRN